MTNKLSQ